MLRDVLQEPSGFGLRPVLEAKKSLSAYCSLAHHSSFTDGNLLGSIIAMKNHQIIHRQSVISLPLNNGDLFYQLDISGRETCVSELPVTDMKALIAISSVITFHLTA